MSKREYSSQQGFSLIELLVVVVILGIMVGFAVLALGSSAKNLDRQNIAREFKVALERARFDSVKRHPASCSEQARVELTSPTSFAVITDQNQNGVLDLGDETRVVNLAARGNTAVVNPTVTSTIVFRFDERGHVTSGPCSAPTEIPSTVTFCDLPCSVANDSTSNIIFISPTGTAAFLNGGSTIPTFGSPTLGNVTTSMNPLTAVWDLITNSNTSNGNTSNGNTTNGNTTNGNTTNGNTTNGNTSNGNTTNGNTSNGNTTNGNTTNGNTSNGNTTNGNTSNGNTTNGNTNTTPVYCLDNAPPVGCVCGPTQHLQAGKCRKNH